MKKEKGNLQQQDGLKNSKIDGKIIKIIDSKVGNPKNSVSIN